MGPYSLDFADLYDLFYAEKDYHAEAGFVAHILHLHCVPGKQLLELACGTGNHALELERLGYDVIATDLSNDMIRRAEQKKRERNSSLTIRPMDMRAIDYPPETFDAVICLFDSVGYVRTNQALLDTLNGVHSVLRPKGLFLFEFWHAGAMLRNFEPLRVRRWATSNGIVERLSETSIDYATNLVTVSYSVYQNCPDGSLKNYQEEHVNRCFSIPEMDNYLQQSELAPLSWYAGFKDSEKVGMDTWHIVSLARKQAGPKL